MDKQTIFEMMNTNPVFHLATIEKGEPRVRGMLLYKADEGGIIFHTGTSKELYTQVMENPKVELCFSAQGTQIRVRGELQIVEDKSLKDEIAAHPSRKFLQVWMDNGLMKDLYSTLVVFRLIGGKATTWTMAQNFEPKEYIHL